MKEKIKELFKSKKVISYCFIFAVALFICIPLFSKTIDISRDDGIQHISRLIGTSQSLKQEDTFPGIISSFCNGFGYSWNLFYSPLTAYVPLIFQLISSSYVVCLKLFMFATMFLSGIYMFKLVYGISKSYTAGVLGAFIYITFPYHLTDLYSRVAVAELASFIFLPMVFYGMQQLFHKQYQHACYIAIGAIGLILCHTIIAMYTALFALVYLLFYRKTLQDRKVRKHLYINAGIILLCVSFFVFPLLQSKIATQYEVFIPERMYTTNTLINSKLGLAELFISRYYGMLFHIGIPILLGMIFLVRYRKKIEHKEKKEIGIFFCLGLVSLWMATKLFPMEHLPAIFKMIQFQWRMLEFFGFFFSIISAITIAMYINSRKDKKNIVIEVCLTIYTIILLMGSVHMVEIPFNENSFLEAIPVTKNTGRVHPNCATFEYLPQKAFKHLSYITERSQEALVVKGKATILEQTKKNTTLTCTVEQVEKDTQLELPYIYYIGYQVTMIKQDNTKLNLPIQESENGFIQVQLPEMEKGRIEVSYQGTLLMKITYGTSIIGIIILVTYCYFGKKEKK